MKAQGQYKAHGQYRVGSRVKIVPQHWLRALDEGVVIAYERRGQKNYLVQFEDSYPGGGIDGDRLWFDESEFSEVAREAVESRVILSALESEKEGTAFTDIAPDEAPMTKNCLKPAA
jgi:hypothetical protein